MLLLLQSFQAFGLALLAQSIVYHRLLLRQPVQRLSPPGLGLFDTGSHDKPRLASRHLSCIVGLHPTAIIKHALALTIRGEVRRIGRQRRRAAHDKQRDGDEP